MKEKKRWQVETLGANLAAIMITYPSTCGVFEETVAEICSLVHSAGGQVYLDGANMNAQVGLCRPGEYGSDVSHLNLHKTFAIPHGGGGPGMGPIGVKSHLVPFLPGHPLLPGVGGSGGAVSAAPFGSASILAISWAYIRMMGAAGLTHASQVRSLSSSGSRPMFQSIPVLGGHPQRQLHDAAVVRGGLQGPLQRWAAVSWAQVSAVSAVVVWRGGRAVRSRVHPGLPPVPPLRRHRGRGHRKAPHGLRVLILLLALECQREMEMSRFHAPTMSWPVAGCLMVEPTESESQAELDRFCDALLAIRAEIGAIERGSAPREGNILKAAPHTMAELMATHWDRPYSREQAAFPMVGLCSTAARVVPLSGSLNSLS